MNKYECPKNDFEYEINDIWSLAAKKKINVDISVSALVQIYELLSYKEQQKNVCKFILVLKNI
jgi:hypothetical protein